MNVFGNLVGGGQVGRERVGEHEELWRCPDVCVVWRNFSWRLPGLVETFQGKVSREHIRCDVDGSLWPKVGEREDENPPTSYSRIINGLYDDDSNLGEGSSFMLLVFYRTV